MGIDFTQYKKRLEEEREQLEERLGHLARRNPSDPTDFQTTYKEEKGERQLSEPDPADRARGIQEYENRNAIEVQIEERYNNVLGALNRIENHTYGWCEVEGDSHEIEEGRLDANPAAQTCVAHKDVQL